ncbi:MAG: acyltransferase [Ktedonobacterales bacterium]|nr:acyltransferase [Ktedonobacterales bacterium]
MLRPLARKLREAVAARYYLRSCTHVGRYVRVDGRLIVRNEGKMYIGERVKFRSTVVRCELVTYAGGRLEIGDRTAINYGSSLAAHERIQIGADCLLGPYTNIIDNNYHDIFNHTRTPPSRPVVIGDAVWIGARVLILPGVTIGDHAVIGAGAVVTESVPARAVVSGNPARIVATF